MRICVVCVVLCCVHGKRTILNFMPEPCKELCELCTNINVKEFVENPAYWRDKPLYIANEKGCDTKCSDDQVHRILPIHKNLNESTCVSYEHVNATNLCEFLLAEGKYINPIDGSIRLFNESFSKYALTWGQRNCHGLDQEREDPSTCHATYQYYDTERGKCKFLPDFDAERHIDWREKNSFLPDRIYLPPSVTFWKMRTDCSLLGKYEISSGTVSTDRECGEYTVCGGRTTGMFEVFAATGSSDRLCQHVAPCKKGQYFDAIGVECRNCASGTYQDMVHHYSTECVMHDTEECGRIGKSLITPVDDLLTTQTTSEQCYGFMHTHTTKTKVKYERPIGSVQSPCPPPTPTQQYYQFYFGAYDDEFTCEVCTKCDHYIKPCGQYRDAECGEPPQIEAMYVFFLAAFVAYMIGTVALYVIPKR